MILDVSSKHKTPAPSGNKDNDIVNFADAFQRENLDIKNLAFEEEDKNDEVEGEDRTIKDEKQAELRTTIPNDLPFAVVIPRRQGSKKTNNSARRYNLRRSARGTR